MATTKGAKPFYADPTEDHVEPTPTSCLTFTPCTRMSNLTLASQSTTENNGRTRFFSYNQRPATDFNTKLKRAFAANEQDTQNHPNLSMVVGGEKISFDRLQNNMHCSGMLFHSDEDESEEDEEDLLRAYSSPEHSPSSSPERFTLDSIFDMNVKMPTPQGFGDSPLVVQQQQPLQLHDDEEEDDDDEHYDPTFSWVNQIYEDSDGHEDDLIINNDYYYADDDKNINNNNNNNFTDNENVPPPSLSSSKKRGKTRSWACSNSSNSSSASSSSSSSSTFASTSLSPERRAPLQELPLDDLAEDNNDELHPRKKMILNNKKSIGDYRTPTLSSSSSRTSSSSRKSFMRALSPSSSRKGKEPASN